MDPFHLLLLAGALVIILAGAELFTNGIEWFGHHLDLAEGAVGSVLAAVGTALPETLIPVVAILGAGAAAEGAAAASEEIGVGAILGAPFMLATLACFVTGLAVVIRGRRRPEGDRMAVDTHVLSTDVGWFLVAYLVAIGAAFLPVDLLPVRAAIAVLLLVLYGLYVRAHLGGEAGEGDPDSLAPLRLHRVDRAHHRREPQVPRLRIVSFQVVVALLLIIIGATAFVDGVESVSTSLGIAPVLLALVIAPIATELPEKFNSILWVRAGKDTLALGNVTGAMVFQSCIPAAIGIVFAAGAWRIDPASPTSLLAFVSAGIAILSTIAIFGPMRLRGRLHGRGLLVGGLLYLVYLAIVIAAAGSLAL